MKGLIFMITGLLCLCFMQKLNASSSGIEDGFERIPASPTAASLLRAVNTSEDLFTGTEKVSFPITEIVADGISIPIELNYVNGNGVRVGQEASNFGLGWESSCNYGIVREIRGKKDEGNTYGTDFSYTYQDPDRYHGWYHNPKPNATENDLHIYAGFNFPAKNYTDTEPDIFNVNLPNLHFKFFFDVNQQIQTIPANLPVIVTPFLKQVSRDDLESNTSPNNSFNQIFYKWEIVDPEGTTYLIGEDENGNSLREKSRLINGGVAAQDYDFFHISQWYLSKMTTAKLKDEVRFNYVIEKYVSQGLMQEEAYFKSKYQNEDDLGCTPDYPVCLNLEYLSTAPNYVPASDFDRTNFYIYDGHRLESVENETVKVVFNTLGGNNYNREDLNFTGPDIAGLGDLEGTIAAAMFGNSNISLSNHSHGPKAIESIELQFLDNSSGNFECDKIFTLNTNYYNANSSFVKNIRLMLESIDETTCTLDPALTLTTSFEYDLSGFGNSALNLPSKLSYARDYWGYYNGKDANNSLIARLVPPSGDMPAGGTYADKRADYNFTSAGILTKINYPTGGIIEFEYEPNEGKVNNHIVYESGNQLYTDVSLCSSGNCCYELQDENVPLDFGEYEIIQNAVTPSQVPNWYVAFDVNLSAATTDEGLFTFNRSTSNVCANTEEIGIIVENNGTFFTYLGYISSSIIDPNVNSLSFQQIGLEAGNNYTVWIQKRTGVSVSVVKNEPVSKNTLKGAGLRIARKTTSDGDGDPDDDRVFIFDYNFKSISDEISGVKECQGQFVRNPFPQTLLFDTDGITGTSCDNLDMFQIPKRVGENCFGCCGEVLGAVPVHKVLVSENGHSKARIIPFDIVYKQVKTSVENIGGFSVSEFRVPQNPDGLDRFNLINGGSSTHNDIYISSTDEIVPVSTDGFFQSYGQLLSVKDYDLNDSCVRSVEYNYKNLMQNITAPKYEATFVSLYGNINFGLILDLDYAGVLEVQNLNMQNFNYDINHYVLESIVSSVDGVQSTMTYIYDEPAAGSDIIFSKPIAIEQTMLGSTDIKRQVFQFTFNNIFTTSDPNYPAIQLMQQNNMYSEILESSTYLNGVLIDGNKVDYKVRSGSYIRPSDGQSFDVDQTLVPEVIYKVQNGQFELAARIDDWNENGSPLCTYIALIGTDVNDTNVSDITKYYEYPECNTYYNDGRLQSRTLSNRTSSFQYYPDGQLHIETDPNGINKEYTYDDLNRLYEAYEANGTQKTTYQYEFQVGGLPENYITEIVSFPLDASLNDQIVTTVQDGLGRDIYAILDGYKKDGSDLITNEKFYGAGGRFISEKIAGKGTQHYIYEQSPLSRMIAGCNDAGCNYYYYWHNLNAITEPGSGKVHPPGTLLSQRTADLDFNERTEYNTFYDKLISIEELKDDGTHMSTRNGYNSFLQLIQVQPPSGSPYIYTYDSNGYLASKSIPGENGSNTYRYDKLGRNVLMQTPGAYRHVTVYDEYNRIIKSGLLTSSIPTTDYFGLGSSALQPNTILKENIYDGSNNEKDWLFKEKVKQTAGSSMFETEYITDDLGRQDQIIRDNHLGGQDIVINTINDAGLLTAFSQSHSSIDGAGNTVSLPSLNWTNHYDTHHRKKGVSLNGTRMTNRNYDDFGRLNSKQLHQISSDVYLQTIDFSYDDLGRLTDINDIESQDNSNCESIKLCDQLFTIEYETQAELLSLAFNSITGINSFYPTIANFTNTSSSKDAFKDALILDIQNEGYVIDDVSITVISNGSIYLATIILEQTNLSLINVAYSTYGLGDYDFDQASTSNCCGDTESKDLFAQKLVYNGSLIQTNEWQQLCSDFNSYNYHYDKQGRLKFANYAYRTNYTDALIGDDDALPASGMLQSGRYSTAYEYDDLGNIQILYRNGVVSGTPGNYSYGKIDALDYNYTNDKLSSVKDYTLNTKGFNGTATGSYLQSNYSYDNTGNLISSSGTSLNIQDNYLNKPSSLGNVNGTVYFDYTADGSLISKEFYDPSGVLVQSRDMVGNLEFIDGNLNALVHDDGKVIIENNGGAWSYRFQYKIEDYQGNPVVWFEDWNGDGLASSSEVVQEKQYYPFGMPAEGEFVGTVGVESVSQFNNMEWIEELDAYHTLHRMLDPTIGRWWSIDPEAEGLAVNTPYNFAGNNPVMMTDPNGDSVIMAIGLLTVTLGVINQMNNLFHGLEVIESSQSPFRQKKYKTIYILSNLAMIGLNIASIGSGGAFLAPALGKKFVNNIVFQAVKNALKSIVLPYVATLSRAYGESSAANLTSQSKKNRRKNIRSVLYNSLFSWTVDMISIGLIYKAHGVNAWNGKVIAKKVSPKLRIKLESISDGLEMHNNQLTLTFDTNKPFITSQPKFFRNSPLMYNTYNNVVGSVKFINTVWGIRNLPIMGLGIKDRTYFGAPDEVGFYNYEYRNGARENDPFFTWLWKSYRKKY